MCPFFSGILWQAIVRAVINTLRPQSFYSGGASKVESARPATHNKHSVAIFVRFVSIAAGLELCLSERK